MRVCWLTDRAHWPSNGGSRAVTVKHLVKYALVVCGVVLVAQAYDQAENH
ncbi:hypothetical protein COMA1_30432 [Candidatus Nitrospira nitrosa]|uniref:Uncharacterized protein n=1 Tax=Candidatus Nitrospira nitrosa TaxID=1742972 RepID=A0A0S4LK66_9BACT|nr:hypothetical protein COMA1_30432 [Candidatus Nitrospira nitrosa]